MKNNISASRRSFLTIAIALLAIAFLGSPATWAGAAGSLDATFNPGWGPNGDTNAIVTQPDGKVIIGGTFGFVDGVLRARIARLNADGSLDLTFNVGSGASSLVHALVLQPDGKIIVGGNFQSINGVLRKGIARFYSDGSLDPSFDPGSGIDIGSVYALALQPDGKIIMGGDFYSVNDVERSQIARLNSDGSLDTLFASDLIINSSVRSMVLQPDGKVIIAGYFDEVNGAMRYSLARLNSDGSLDVSFDPGVIVGTRVDVLALRSDGKVMMGGYFSSVQGVARNSIARLNSNGSLDTGFDPGVGQVMTVADMVLQPDGKTIIGGVFTSINGIARNHIARLNSDGSLDTGFDPGTGAGNFVDTLALQADGKLLISGSFYTYNNISMYRVARIHSGDSDSDSTQDGTDVFPLNNAAATDIDSDGLPDEWLQPNPYSCLSTAPACNGLMLDDVVDPDHDGSFGADDNCHLIINIDQQDGDEDGLGDVCDEDRDNDDVTNWLDNCPLFANASQLDSNGNGLGDICDPDPLVASPAGTRDHTFKASTGDSGVVNALAAQPDGKWVIAGQFTSVNGVVHNRTARLNPNGSLDTTFHVGTGAVGYVYAVALQSDGKTLMGGNFTAVNGVTTLGIARLNTDGSVDTSFIINTNAASWVEALALQPDGRIVLGGTFTTVNGVARNRIARLNSDGSLDATFNIGSGLDSTVHTLALQPDGKILVGGNFTLVNGVIRNRMARLNSDGSLDTLFDSSSNGIVHALALVPDGKIVIGGAFTTVDGVVRNRIARLNSNGSLDTSFNPGTGANNPVYAVVVQPDHKVIIGGVFTSVNGTLRNRIARLNADGLVDLSFNPGTGTNAHIKAVVLEPGGKLLVGGNFSTYDDAWFAGVVRVHTGDADADGIQDAGDAFPTNPTEQHDTDNDTIGNNADWDDDGDGIPDVVDAAPLDGGNAGEIALPLDGIYKGGRLGSQILAP